METLSSNQSGVNGVYPIITPTFTPRVNSNFTPRMNPDSNSNFTSRFTLPKINQLSTPRLFTPRLTTPTTPRLTTPITPRLTTPITPRLTTTITPRLTTPNTPRLTTPNLSHTSSLTFPNFLPVIKYDKSQDKPNNPDKFNKVEITMPQLAAYKRPTPAILPSPKFNPAMILKPVFTSISTPKITSISTPKITPTPMLSYLFSPKPVFSPNATPKLTPNATQNFTPRLVPTPRAISRSVPNTPRNILKSVMNEKFDFDIINKIWIPAVIEEIIQNTQITLVPTADKIPSDKPSHKLAYRPVTLNIVEENPLLKASIYLDCTKPEDRDYYYVSDHMKELNRNIVNLQKQYQNELKATPNISGMVSHGVFENLLSIYENNQVFYQDKLEESDCNKKLISDALTQLEHWFMCIIEPMPKNGSNPEIYQEELFEWRKRESFKRTANYSKYCDPEVYSYIQPLPDNLRLFIHNQHITYKI